MSIPKHTCICQTCGSQWQNPKYEEHESPSCGNCGRHIKWDWCGDCFAIQASPGKWVLGPSQDLGEEDDATAHLCLCGHVLTIVSPYFGSVDVCAPPNIDWDLPENYYEPC